MIFNPPSRSLQITAACVLSVCGLLVMLNAAPVPRPGTSVESFGPVTAQQVSNGLGFVIPQQNQDWQFAAAAAAGAKHVRFQCSWNNIEKQTSPPNNRSLGFAEDPDCARGFASTAKYGLKATVVAAYGPPYHKILGVTLPSGAEVGATNVTIQFASGVGGDTLKNLVAPYDYILGADGRMITSVHNYAGSFITGVSQIDSTHAILSLSSALTQSLPANTTTQYVINEILYPSAVSFRADDPSVVAYTNYVSWLAADMAARGVSGEIEIWNEPPWVDDAWDNRGDLYDTFPSGWAISSQFGNGPNYGFAANLQERSLPRGITLVWSGTNKSGGNSLLLPGFRTATGSSLAQPSTTISSESFHPYGNTPEQMMWSPGCLQASVHAGSNPDAYQNCYGLEFPMGSTVRATSPGLGQRLRARTQYYRDWNCATRRGTTRKSGKIYHEALRRISGLGYHAGRVLFDFRQYDERPELRVCWIQWLGSNLLSLSCVCCDLRIHG
jgi:hypothetical protein